MSTKQHFGVFDIMGPIMLGPSSSHTGGATRIGLLAGQLCRYKPVSIQLDFYGSLSSTYRGHKTDVGLVGGLLGIHIDNELIKQSLQIAKERGISVEYGTAQLKNAHPNTVVITLTDEEETRYIVQGFTVGGGLCEIEKINDIPVQIDGKKYVAIFPCSKEREVVKQRMEKLGLRVEISKDRQGILYVIAKSPEKINIALVQELAGKGKVHLFAPIMDVQKKDLSFFKTAVEMKLAVESRGISLSECVLEHEMKSSGCTRAVVIQKMRDIYDVMCMSIEKGQAEISSLLGHTFEGNAAKVQTWNQAGNHVISPLVSSIIRSALAVMEVNGSMGKVATCPTAGSCGIVPAALIGIATDKEYPPEKVVDAMFVASGLGILIAQNATISGAVGGCQAEVGSACAMAAGAITHLLGGSIDKVYSAAALALGNLIGLTCDPVAGMVELPCIQRNVMGALNAIGSAEMALSGVDSVVELDEVIGAMKEAGDLMHKDLRDTLGAGLSNTATARAFEKKIFGKEVKFL